MAWLFIASAGALVLATLFLTALLLKARRSRGWPRPQPPTRKWWT